MLCNNSHYPFNTKKVIVNNYAAARNRKPAKSRFYANLTGIIRLQLRSQPEGLSGLR